MAVKQKGQSLVAGAAAGGIIHLINSGAATLDATGCMTRNGQPVMKPLWEISEQDVINVLELVLNEYPVDRGAVFLAGHSMGSGGTWLIGPVKRSSTSTTWPSVPQISGAMKAPRLTPT